MSSQAAQNLTPRQRRSAMRGKRLKDMAWSFVFLLPYLVLLFMFGVIPIAYAFGLSFMDTFSNTFYGLENYRFVFNDYRFFDALGNVLTYLGIWMAFMIIGVVALALMLDAVTPGLSKFYRGVYFAPGAVASSALVILWLFVLDPTVSPYGALMDSVNWTLRADVINSMGLPLIFALMAFSTHSGGWIVVMGGALSGLPKEVIEAARIDGANRFQLAMRIKLPMIWRTVVLMTVLGFANGLQIFVEPQLMSLAGEQFATTDWSMNQIAFEYAFKLADFGASAAMSTMLVGTSVGIALFVIFGTKFYRID